MADSKPVVTPTEVKPEDVTVPTSTVIGEDGKEYVAEVDPKSVFDFPVVAPTDSPKLVVEAATVEEEVLDAKDVADKKKAEDNK